MGSLKHTADAAGAEPPLGLGVTRTVYILVLVTPNLTTEKGMRKKTRRTVQWEVAKAFLAQKRSAGSVESAGRFSI